MAIDINFNNQNKHWILIIIDKIKSFIFAIWKFISNIGKKICHLLKRFWKVLVGITASAIIISIGFCGYDYYKNTYIPQKLLDEAVADISNKFYSKNDSIKGHYAYSILETDYNWEYEGVSNEDIRMKLEDLRDKAFSFIESKAFAGIPKYQYALGQLYYFQNNYLPKDDKKAVYWWYEAAKQGYTKAYNNVGIAYKQGTGVGVNKRKAIEWLKRGAEAGEDYAQANYGDLFLEGVKIKIGSHKKLKPGYNPRFYDKYDLYAWDDVPEYEIIIERDIDQAKFWWKKAAAQGNEAAKDALQRVYN